MIPVCGTACVPATCDEAFPLSLPSSPSLPSLCVNDASPRGTGITPVPIFLR